MCSSFLLFLFVAALLGRQTEIRSAWPLHPHSGNTVPSAMSTADALLPSRDNADRGQRTHTRGAQRPRCRAAAQGGQQRAATQNLTGSPAPLTRPETRLGKREGGEQCNRQGRLSCRAHRPVLRVRVPPL